MLYGNSELSPAILNERDYEALQETERAGKHKFAWALFGIADDIAAGAAIALTMAIGGCFGIGVYVVAVASSRGTGVMLSAALVPIALYAAFELPQILGGVDFTVSKHRHLYPSALGLAFVLMSLLWWLVLLAYLT